MNLQSIKNTCLFFIYFFIGFFSFVLIAFADGAQMYFRSGFEPDTLLIKGETISGVDQATGYDWDKFGHYVPSVKKILVKYYNGRFPLDAFSEIIDDPEGRFGKVLHHQVNDDDGGDEVVRVSTDMLFDSSTFNQLAVRYNYRLHPSFQDYLKSQFSSWFVISELWTDGPQDDRASLAVGLRKNKNQFNFEVTFRYRDDSKWNTLWKIGNTNFAVPVGKWMRITVFFKKGKEGTGRFYLKCNDTVVFDIQDKSFDFKGRGWSKWNALKTYLGDDFLDWMRNNGTPAQTYYDDFQAWSEIPGSVIPSTTQMPLK